MKGSHSRRAGAFAKSAIMALQNGCVLGAVRIANSDEIDVPKPSEFYPIDIEKIKCFARRRFSDLIDLLNPNNHELANFFGVIL
jgi:hypothetical protein